jgi:hypothetical protein
MLSFIPIKPGTKIPAIDWAPYQKVCAAPEVVKSWLEGGACLALVTGKVSGNLEVLDFDVADCFQPWASQIGQELFNKFTVVQTIKGYHLYYTCDEIGRNQVLAKKKSDGKAMIETRAEGGYVVTPSSNDTRYKFLEGDHDSIPHLTVEEREIMFCAARQFCEKPKVIHGRNRVPGKPGDDYNEKAPPWEDILNKAGWGFVRERSDGISEWRRPGKTDGISATVGVHGKDILYVFSSSVDNLEPGAYNKFSYLAATEYDGDFSACAKQLAKDGYGTQKSQKDFLAALVDAVASRLDTFKGKDGNAYCYVPERGVVAIGSELYKGIITVNCKAAEIGEFISPTVVDQVSNSQTREVLAEGEERDIFARVGYNDEERAVYVDMGERNTRAVKITKDGWSIVDEANVYFATTQRRTALPEPQKGGSLDDLKGLINAKDADDYNLIMAWMLSCFNPHGAFPILILHGDAASAKSVGTKIIRTVVDPSNILSTLTKPSSVESVMQVAYSNYVLAYDNLSGITNAVSDALCQLATGSGYATRKLYTNMELVVYDCKRPVILNGIDQLAKREDFGSRALVIEFMPIPKENKKAEGEIYDQLEKRMPKFLGALYDAVACALEGYSHTQTDDFESRLTDFVNWTVAGLPAFEGWDRAGFKAALEANEAAVTEDMILLNPVSEYVEKFMSSRDVWEGSAEELLERLTGLATPALMRSQDWPKSNSSLSFKLNRAAASLGKIGIEVERLRVKGKRTVRITNANTSDN